MFRKLVANLPFSPALVGQLGFYARRLKKEQATRQLGLIFTALAIAVQSFAMIQPPESANAAGGQDCSDNSIMRCGAQNREEFVAKYHQNASLDLGQIYDHYGLTNAVITGASVKYGLSYKDGRIEFNGETVATGSKSLGRQNNSGSREPVSIGGKTYYTSPAQSIYRSNSIRILGFFDANDNFIAGILLDCGNPVQAVRVKTNVPPPPPQPEAVCDNLQLIAIDRTHFKLTGSAHGINGGTVSNIAYYIFDANNNTVAAQQGNGNPSTVTLEVAKEGTYTARAIAITSVGNRISTECTKQLTVAPQPMCPINPSLPANSPECKPCEGNKDIWYKDKDCKSKVTLTKKATNLTQGGVDATTVAAKPGDRIQYSLIVKNTGSASEQQTISDRVDDVTQYASIQNNGGGTYDKAKGTISYGMVSIKPQQTVTRTFTVQLANAIPSTPAGTTNPESFDCKMANVFGNAVTVTVECPPEKQVEVVVSQLPSTGPKENALVGAGILMVATYLLARARQKRKEVRLIRHDLNMGTI